jgi:hypothetical protein
MGLGVCTALPVACLSPASSGQKKVAVFGLCATLKITGNKNQKPRETKRPKFIKLFSYYLYIVEENE